MLSETLGSAHRGLPRPGSLMAPEELANTGALKWAKSREVSENKIKRAKT